MSLPFLRSDMHPKCLVVGYEPTLETLIVRCTVEEYRLPGRDLTLYSRTAFRTESLEC
jgi:hypothetical protein